MNTSKAIAGVSYNSADFLAVKLHEWLNAGLIEFGTFIKHKAEADEKKDHIHVFLLPARRIQTLDFENDSKEYDENNPGKPLKVLGLSPSKFSDWLLYSLHDKAYLLEKGLSRQYAYSLEDFYSTDLDRFDIMISQISDDKNSKIEHRLLQMINNQMSWQEILSSGLIPMRYVYSAKIVYDSLTRFDNNNKNI